MTEKIDGSDYADMFVTEEDTFDVTLKYYKKDGKVYTDIGTDGDFVLDESCKQVTLTLKYPDQSDCSAIAHATPKMGQDVEKMDIRDFLSMELTRMIILMRKWSIDKVLDQSSIMALNSRIVKGLLIKIRDKIGMEGII